jgi:hypothetical protein
LGVIIINSRDVTTFGPAFATATTTHGKRHEVKLEKKEEGADDFGKNERRGSFFFARLDGVFFSLLLSIHTHTRHPEKTKQVANRGREREKGLHVIANGF